MCLNCTTWIIKVILLFECRWHHIWKNFIIKSSSFRGDVDTAPVGGTIDVSGLKLIFLFHVFMKHCFSKRYQSSDRPFLFLSLCLSLSQTHVHTFAYGICYLPHLWNTVKKIIQWTFKSLKNFNFFIEDWILMEVFKPPDSRLNGSYPVKRILVFWPPKNHTKYILPNTYTKPNISLGILMYLSSCDSFIML